MAAAVLVLEMTPGDQSGGGGVIHVMTYPLRFPCSLETRNRPLAGAAGEGTVGPAAFGTLAYEQAENARCVDYVLVPRTPCRPARARTRAVAHPR